jgi:hypothetical protein
VVCCAPKAVQEWSGLRAAGKTAVDLNKQTIIINNTSPIYVPQDLSYQTSARTDFNAGGGSPYGGGLNVGYGANPGLAGPYPYGANVQAGVSAGPQGMNAKINF